jgi:histidine triad (HIT) family protein
VTEPAAIPECLFCEIASGDAPAGVLHADEATIAFSDISPQAPVHFLVIPRSHYPDAAALAAGEPGTMDRMIGTARQVAETHGAHSYRLVFNTGAEAHQTVFHAHLHVLAGRSMSWPPG